MCVQITFETYVRERSNLVLLKDNLLNTKPFDYNRDIERLFSWRDAYDTECCNWCTGFFNDNRE